MKNRCERNIAGREEDTAAGVAYTPCGKPATHVVRQRGHEEWAACDEHAAEAESDGCDIVAAGRRVPFVLPGMIVHPDDCVNCERGGHPLWCSPIVVDIRDDERWGMTATLLYRNGEVRDEPCQELRRRWRLARDFDQTRVYTREQDAHADYLESRGEHAAEAESDGCEIVREGSL